MEDSQTLTNNSVISNRSITSTQMNQIQVTFLDKKDLIIKPDCHICQKKFGNIQDVRKNCKMCGQSCCKVCSNRKKDNQRICDLCYYKLYYAKSEKRKKDFIQMSQGRIEDLKNSIEEGKGKLKMLNESIMDITQKTQQEICEQTNKLQDLQKEHDQIESILNQQQENLKEKHRDLDTKKEQEIKLKKKLEDLQLKNNKLEATYETNKKTLQQKMDEFQKLTQQSEQKNEKDINNINNISKGEL